MSIQPKNWIIKCNTKSIKGEFISIYTNFLYNFVRGLEKYERMAHTNNNMELRASTLGCRNKQCRKIAVFHHLEISVHAAKNFIFENQTISQQNSPRTNFISRVNSVKIKASLVKRTRKVIYMLSAFSSLFVKEHVLNEWLY